MKYPLIRFESRKWLDKLINGELFMRNSFYYQTLEESDSARSDTFDGSAPFADKNRIMESIIGQEVRNARLMVLDRYIKCFYHCTEDDFIQTESGLWKLSLSGKAKDAANEFNADSVLLVFEPIEFIKQVEKVCARNNESFSYGNVKYIDYDEQGFTTVYDDIFRNNKIYELPFYKDKKFSNQKEFRICIQHQYINADETTTVLYLPKSIGDITYSINIGKIENACILSKENFLKNGVLLDVKNEHYYVCEE